MLITPEDLDRLARLEIEREGDHDVVWACRLARKLAWIKPTEAQFQDYVGLVNENTSSAFTMRHDETLFLKGIVRSEDPKFVHDFSCDKTEAFLCVRPYVILEAPKSPDIIWSLEMHSSWKILVGGKPLASGWLAEILVALDGYGVRRKPYTFAMPKESIENVFCVGTLDYRGVEIPGTYHMQGPTVTPMPTAGVFLANGAKLEMTIELPKILKENPTIHLLVGLVAARYTTKPRGSGVVAPVDLKG